MKTSDFNFELPEELIAQDPLADRSSSRLLMVDKQTGEWKHEVFRNIIDYLKPGDCLVLNNTKVLPARLMGTKEDTGASVEILLLKRREGDVWETLVKPGKKMRPGARVVFGDGLMDLAEIKPCDNADACFMAQTHHVAQHISIAKIRAAVMIG